MSKGVFEKTYLVPFAEQEAAKERYQSPKKIAPRGAARGNEAKEKGQNQQKEYETNNDKDNIIGIWDEAGGDKDGAAGEEVAIDAGDIQDGSSRDGTASADVGSGAADIRHRAGL